MNYKNAFNLTGKVAIVVGGAGGIGGEIVRAFSSNGCNIAIADLKAEPVPIVSDIRQKGVKCEMYCTDATDEAQVKQTVKKILADFGRIDILVNCAGSHVHKSFIDYTAEDWARVMDGNLKGDFLFTREVGAYMIQQRKGRIINISSVKSVIGMSDKYVAYCTAKGGVNMFTKGLASEWAKYGITVNALAPTFILTQMAEAELQQEGEAFRQKIVERIPVGRFGQTRDVALGALYFASDFADFITGQVLFVDGGLTSIQ